MCMQDNFNHLEDRVSDETASVEETRITIQKLEQEAQTAKDEVS